MFAFFFLMNWAYTDFFQIRQFLHFYPENAGFRMTNARVLQCCVSAFFLGFMLFGIVSVVPVGSIVWLSFNKLNFSFPRQCFLAQLVLSLADGYIHLFFLDTLPSSLLFWCVVDLGHGRAGSGICSFTRECKLLLIRSLKRIQGGLINQFFFHIRLNKPVYGDCPYNLIRKGYVVLWLTPMRVVW